MLQSRDIMGIVAHHLAYNRDVLRAACLVCRAWQRAFGPALYAFDRRCIALMAARAGRGPGGPAPGFLRNLRALSVRGSPVAGAFLEAVVGGCPSLRRLDIRWTLVEDWRPLGALPYLSDLAVCCHPFGSRGTRRATLLAVRRLPRLTALLVSAARVGEARHRLYAWDITVAVQRVPPGCTVTVDLRRSRVFKDPASFVAMTAAQLKACCQAPIGRRITVLGPGGGRARI